ncbi:MAG: hypothetical protein ABSH52_29205 [Terriglobia bacterium]|jgi:hypothetical protein
MREHFGEKLRAQALELQGLEERLEELRAAHRRLEAEARDQFEALGNPESSSPSTPLADVLAAARSLLAATSPRQLFSLLAEVSHRLGVRAVVFEVRGEAAWASAAHGFGASLNEQTLRSLVVPLSVETPFRGVFNLGVDVSGTSEVLSKNPNVLSRLKPDALDSILLLPIRAGGTVAAIFYADSGGCGALPEDALKLLAEFAGAQLERLTALGGSAREATDYNGPSV